jgi:hypothetical protein
MRTLGALRKLFGVPKRIDKSEENQMSWLREI